MNDHLPECLMNLEYAVRVCICSELRACEQRVTERWESLRGWGESYAYKTGSDNGFLIGYAAALDAAEAAVAAVPWYRAMGYTTKDEFIAVIRALKEKP